VDRAAHVSVDGRDPADVRMAGYGYAERAGSRGAGWQPRCGLAAAVRIYYPRGVFWGSCSILVVANVINIGADLGGMAEATQLITGIRALI
jgi:hypothetical protein